MAGGRRKINEDARFRVLRLLHEDPEMSQRELAKAAGVSVGGLHYVLSALIEKGFVKLGNFTAARDKRRYAYNLTPKGVTEKAVMTQKFLTRKMAEYEALKAEIAEIGKDLPAKESDRIRPKAR